jgi:mannose-1-phosphate guanylyltransferase/mannose-6-phosphate isomerase
LASSSVFGVILAGGVGTRLWPLSRTNFPKQFIRLAFGESLFQASVRKVNYCLHGRSDYGGLFAVSNQGHAEIVDDQLSGLGDGHLEILLEPVARNTAPAVSFAALRALQLDDDPVLVILPADQHIEHAPNFKNCLSLAVEGARNGRIMLVGVQPSSPHTQYGYLKIDDGDDAERFPGAVSCFIEKPELSLAKEIYKSGNYLWNAGIFVMKARVWLDALRYFRPDIYETTLKACGEMTRSSLFTTVGKDAYSRIPSESVDYAVLEKCPQTIFKLGAVVLDSRWSDFGSWGVFFGPYEKDEDGNVSMGDVVHKRSINTAVSASSRLVCVQGVKDLFIVETPDAVLVAKKSDSDVKDLVEDLRGRGRLEVERVAKNREVRPWGWFEVKDAGRGYQVKKICVKGGESLSLQSHEKRDENWVIVTGVAVVTNGDEISNLNVGDSVRIPAGNRHRLSNPSESDLELIEVQTGEYLGEDDITRYEDKYGRLS